ncbi:MAG: hypothetical protein IT184_16330 [Acidobacteria bacterium]|nr:hypothetical protein [Acidobacteriota bacterium]
MVPSVLYLLGFHGSAAADGKVHSLSVRVNRRDVTVSTRRSYVRSKKGARLE